MAARINPLTGRPMGGEQPRRPGEETQSVERTTRSPITGREVSYQVDEPFQPEPVAPEDMSVSLADFGKSILSGGAGVAAGTGWLLKKLGDEDFGDRDPMVRLGGAIETLGNDAVDYWNESLSEGAQAELAKEFVTKDEQGDWQWGDASLKTVGLYGAQSLLGTAAGMGAGAGITKTLQVFGNPVGRGALVSAVNAGRGAAAGTKAAVQAERAARKLKMVDRILGAAGFGVGEGMVGGTMTGVNVEEQVRNLDADTLMNSDRFQQIYDAQLKSGIDPDAAFESARDTIAKESATTAGFDAGLTTALLGAPMGAFFGQLLGKAGMRATGRGTATAFGAAGEAVQEFAQSGFEAYTSNKALIAAGDPRDIWQDVLNQAIGGAAAGGVMGGAFGAAAGADPEVRQERAEKQAKETKVQFDALETVGIRAMEAGVPKEEIDKVLAEAPAGGLAKAAKDLRELAEHYEQRETAEPEVPTVEEALAEVEAARPKKKGKRKPKKAVPQTTPEVEGQKTEKSIPETTPQVEEVQDGEKGTQRQRTDKRIKKYLQAKRPSNDKDGERVIGYRTEASLAYQQARDEGADPDVTEFLRKEAVWAQDWLAENRPEVYESLWGAEALKERRGELGIAEPQAPETPPTAPEATPEQPVQPEEIVQESSAGVVEPSETAVPPLTDEQQEKIAALKKSGDEDNIVGKQSDSNVIYAAREGRKTIFDVFINDESIGKFDTYEEAYRAYQKGVPPKVAATPEDVAAQANEAAASPKNDLPEPTEAQKSAGNYKKGRVNLPHLPTIMIENPDGSVRKGKGWERTMKGVHYGYFQATEGADNENDGTPREGVDVMVNAAEGATDESLPVFVINQRSKDGSFDEHKVLVGFSSQSAAENAYLAQYENGWTGLESTVRMEPEEFREWLKDPENTTRKATLTEGQWRRQMGANIDEKIAALPEEPEAPPPVTPETEAAPETTPPEAAPLTYPGADIVADQDFGDLELTETVEVLETGETYDVTEEATVVFKQAVKRRDSLQKLWECVNG